MGSGTATIMNEYGHFDYASVDLLEDLNTPAYKIASFEIIDLPLLKYIAKTKKPIIISTGMANFEEISEAVDTVRENQLILGSDNSYNLGSSTSGFGRSLSVVIDCHLTRADRVGITESR